MANLTETPTHKVSAIIPTYNRAGYLREALDSVFAQSLPPWEVIVVDDGSTDDTFEVVQEYGSRVRYVRHDRNQGIAVARNTGLGAAQGDLIAWLDSDDLWEPGFLATVIDILGKATSPDGVYTGITLVDTSNVRLRSSVRTERPEELHDALIRGNFLATPSVVARKACYTRAGLFDQQLRVSEDYDMWLRLARGCRLEGISLPLVRIRVHKGNTLSNADAFCEARLMILRKHFAASEGNDPDRLRRSGLAYGYGLRSIATMYVANGQAEKGWQFLTKAAARHPQILEQLDTYYELALEDQPRAYRGDATQLDIRHSQAEIMQRLEKLFRTSGSRVKDLRRSAYGNAYLALAMLCDQAGEWKEARYHMRRALATNPSLLCQRGFGRRLVKLYLGKRVVRQLRRESRG